MASLSSVNMLVHQSSVPTVVGAGRWSDSLTSADGSRSSRCGAEARLDPLSQQLLTILQEHLSAHLHVHLCDHNTHTHTHRLLQHPRSACRISLWCEMWSMCASVVSPLCRPVRFCLMVKSRCCVDITQQPQEGVIPRGSPLVPESQQLSVVPG